MKLIMQDDARLKFVRPIVVISSGVVFARARQKLVSDARMKVLTVHAYRCQWISVMDGCTPCFEILFQTYAKKRHAQQNNRSHGILLLQSQLSTLHLLLMQMALMHTPNTTRLDGSCRLGLCLFS